WCTIRPSRKLSGTVRVSEIGSEVGRSQRLFFQVLRLRQRQGLLSYVAGLKIGGCLPKSPWRERRRRSRYSARQIKRTRKSQFGILMRVSLIKLLPSSVPAPSPTKGD